MSLNLLEVVRAAQLGEATLSAETAGYLVLASADQLCRMSRRVEAHSISIQETGELVMGDGTASSPAEVELSLRLLLGRLLQLCRASHSGLREVSLRRGNATLVLELEAALIPVNRAAARRAIARLHRETERARKKGLLNDLLAARSALEEPAPERTATSSEPASRRSRPALVVGSSSDASKPFTVQSRPPAYLSDWLGETSRRQEEPGEIEEQTVRLDQIQLNLQVALQKAREEAEARENEAQAPKALDPFHAALAALPTDETPFLGSVAAVMEPEAQPEPETVDAEIEPGAESAADSEILKSSPAEDEAEIEQGWDEIVAEQASIPPLAPEGAASFSLDLDEPSSSADSLGGERLSSEIAEMIALRSAEGLLIPEGFDGATGEASSDESEASSMGVTETDASSPEEPESDVEEPSVEHSRFYTPRKSDLGELLQSLTEHGETSTSDIARQLKQLAGIEAKTNPLRQGVPRSALLKDQARAARRQRSSSLFAPKPLD